MILTIHLVAGAALVSKIQPNPAAFILAFLSHYFLDFLPHRVYSVDNIFEKRWEKAGLDFLKAGLDFSLGTLLIFILAKNWPLALLGAVISVSPDALSILHLIFPKNKILKFHSRFHREIIHYLKNKKISVFWRISSQLAIFILAIFFLIGS